MEKVWMQIDKMIKNYKSESKLVKKHLFESFLACKKNVFFSWKNLYDIIQFFWKSKRKRWLSQLVGVFAYKYKTTHFSFLWNKSTICSLKKLIIMFWKNFALYELLIFDQISVLRTSDFISVCVIFWMVKTLWVRLVEYCRRVKYLNWVKYFQKTEYSEWIEYSERVEYSE